MVKINRSMQEFLKSERTRTKQKQTRVADLCDYCKRFIKLHSQFDWFILRYYGAAKVMELLHLAETNQEESLRGELNNIWFELPDHIFNIRNNPEGWETFLNFVEE